MSSIPYINPLSPVQIGGTISVPRDVNFGVTYSTNLVGGYMEVDTLNDLIYTIPSGTSGLTQFSGNSIPISFVKGNGTSYSPDVLFLNNDNISSGRRKIGMLVFVREQSQIYQYNIDGYETLWNSATAATGTVSVSYLGTTVNNTSVAGQNFINSWTGSTIDGVGGYTATNAKWKKYYGTNLALTGGSFNSITGTLTLTNITGGTQSLTGFGSGGGGGTTITGGTYNQNTLELNLNSSGGTVTINNVTGLYISGGTYSSSTSTILLYDSTGGTVNITGVTATGGGTTVTGGTYNNNYGVLNLVNNTGGTVSVSGFTDQKILLNRIELGTNITEGGGWPSFSSKIYNIFVNSFDQYPECGWNVDYFYTINDTYRKTILYKTETYCLGYNPYDTINNMVTFIESNYSYGTYVNCYCEIYITTSSTNIGIQRITLSNPLFSSLQYRNYSTSGARITGNLQFVIDEVTNKTNNLTNHLTTGWVYYYNTATSEDITKKIYDIVTEPTNPFYGPLSGSAFSAITESAHGWDDQNRAFITKSVYIESTQNYYKNFNIPTNLFCKFSRECRNNLNNFYADLFIDNIGGQPASIVGNSTDLDISYYSPAFVQLVDNYKVLPSGNTYIIKTLGVTTGVRLNELEYDLKIPKYKYLSTRTGGLITGNKDALEILPGYQNVYLIDITSTVDEGDATTFANNFINDYYVRSCSDTIVDNYFGTYTINSFIEKLKSGPSPYGNYIMVQSNDTKMTSLATTGTFNYDTGSVTINSIYKGYAFRPLIYPLNFNQLSFEVPSGYFYNSDTASIDENTYWDENNFVLGGGYITNKVLRIIVNFKKLNRNTFFDLQMKVTEPVVTSSVHTKFFRVTTENPIETSIYDNLSDSERKNLKPYNIEISFAFYDFSRNTTSIIPNYKMIVVKSGENDVFKIVKGIPSY